MPTHVFVYGTLLIPDMMQVVTGRIHESVPAVVRGYNRYSLLGRVYPGIVADANEAVAGLVYLDVDDDSLARLDYFEGPEYVRQQLSVHLDGGETLTAHAYVVPPTKRSLLSDRSWNLEEFCEHGLAAFLQHAHDVMHCYEPGQQVVR